MNRDVEMSGDTAPDGPSSVGILVSDKKKGKRVGNSRAPMTMFDKLAYKNLGYQMRVRLWYDSANVQYFFTGMILLNFITILISATSFALAKTAEAKANKETLQVIDQVFVFIFLIELVINMYGNWFWHFWEVSKWNHFDFIVIALSLAVDNFSAVRVARVVRLLRVLRVAGKLESLRTIVATFDRSMNAVAAVVALLLMLMCIYAVFGVHEFHTNDAVHFGDLGKAMFTMFQLVTIEGWPDIARDLMKVSGPAPFFFVSFMIIAALTTIEVVAAIFLDKMAEAKDYVKEEQALALAEEKAREDIVIERVKIIGQYNEGQISGDELRDSLDVLAKRDDDLKTGRLDKDQVEAKVEKERSMHLSMDMANALKTSVDLTSVFDTNGDGNVDQGEMDAGLIEMLTKLSAQMEELGSRMAKIEGAVGKGGQKGRRNLING